ncbi:uncharacterized protein Dwil_GK18971 [Drosophila willistoni]|uniref:PiggyBac transposable element-derived protein domain-containing protein n=1 Tax=Drosophila willistoni TaxID=7260 RepID=B4NLE2_DROWI|nr:uncharacterized protein LOC6650641 [Drosophila willistoni]EDW84345.1 uncharacterized protein Dwil_GK18971 [Drosophila willistoni]
MDCILDEELLANMKESDDEEDSADEKMQLANESQISSQDEGADPLQEAQPTLCSHFEYAFQDSDIKAMHDEMNETLTNSENKQKRGRGRPSGHISARGHTWSKERGEALEEFDLPTHEACCKGPARTISNAVESWMLLFDEDILRLLMRQINDQIRKRKNRTPNQRLVDIIETRSWLGLSYLCGIFRNSEFNGPLDELWTLELGNAIFRATMSLSRFEFLNECLACISNLNDLWQKFIINCRSYYGASSWLTVDQVNTNLSLCCDAKTLYMTNCHHSSEKNKNIDNLICDFKTTGRNITLGNAYVNIQVCEHLHGHNLSSLCNLSLDANPLDWPKNWQAKSKQILYCKSAILIPTDHDEEQALLVFGLSSNISYVKTYKKTIKASCQFYDLSQRYSTLRSSRSELQNQILTSFYLLLDMAAVNSWILLRLSPKNCTPQIEQRDFHRQLGLFLTQQRLQRRLQHCSSANSSLVMRLQICEILGQSSRRLLSYEEQQLLQPKQIVLDKEKIKFPEGLTISSRYGEKFRRCKPCSRNKRGTKSRSRCQQCLSHRCGNHLISRCFDCMGVTEDKITL